MPSSNISFPLFIRIFHITGQHSLTSIIDTLTFTQMVLSLSFIFINLSNAQFFSCLLLPSNLSITTGACLELYIPDSEYVCTRETVIGSECRIVCDYGFYLDTPYSVLTCQYNGLWDRKQPTCIRNLLKGNLNMRKNDLNLPSVYGIDLHEFLFV